MTRTSALVLLSIVALASAGCAAPRDPAGGPSPTASATQATAPVAPTVALTLTVAPPAPTSNETVLLRGTVGRAAHLSVASVALDAAGGPWTLAVPVKAGQTRLQVLADDGNATASASVLAVRLSTFTFEVQYGHYPGLTDTNAEVLMNIDGRASAPAYAGRKTPHPDFANVHDLTVTWATKAGANVELAWSDSLQGYSMSKINGAGNPVTSSSPPYWVLEVNGKTADFGMTLMPVVPGDHVAWCLNACGV